MNTKKACELELGDRIDIDNGLLYEVEEVSESKNGRIKFTLYPFQNSMSARKRITLPENKSIQLV